MAEKDLLNYIQKYKEAHKKEHLNMRYIIHLEQKLMEIFKNQKEKNDRTRND